MNSLLVLNASIVNEGAITPSDLFVKDGRIERIDGDLSALRADQIIDAAGLMLLPGMIDDQVHFREPGFSHKGSIASESRAAVAGGITSYMEMPNTKPPTTTADALLEKRALANQNSLANYSFYLGATNDNLEVVKGISPRDTCGIKVFMGASTGNMLVDDEAALEGIFSQAPILVAVHCEHTPTIVANEKAYRERFGEDVPMDHHPLIRSVEACYQSSATAVELAQRHATRLHILHLTTARELELLSDKPLEEKHITAEACVHHLFFDETDYVEKGTLIKCNPAIKSRQDRDALRNAVVTGKIDVIATDHAPHTLGEKNCSYFDAPAGLPLVQDSLLSLIERYHEGEFSLPLIVEKTSHAVARLFQIEKRGYIREGYWADLVLIDLQGRTPVTRERVLSKCGWSPFEGYTFRSAIHTTIVSGQVAFTQNRINQGVRGKPLVFAR